MTKPPSFVTVFSWIRQAISARCRCMAVNNSVNASVLCWSISQTLPSKGFFFLFFFFFATWFPQLHLHHNNASFLKCKTKVYWSRNRQWYKSVHLHLAANRGFRATQCSSSPRSHFRVSLKQKEKQSDNYRPFRILGDLCTLFKLSYLQHLAGTSSGM